jgi:hypothetical protein
MVSVIMVSVIMVSVIMVSVIMLSVIMLSVIMLSVIMLSVIMLSVNMLSVIMLSVNMLSVIMLSVNMLSVVVLIVLLPNVTKPLKCSYDYILTLTSEMTAQNGGIWLSFSDILSALPKRSQMSGLDEDRRDPRQKNEPSLGLRKDCSHPRPKKLFSVPLGLYHPLVGVTILKYKLFYFLTPDKKKFKEKGTSF